MTNTEGLEKVIQNEIQRRVSEAIDQKIKSISQEVETKVRSEVGQIVSVVMRRFDYESFKDRLVITVNFENTKQ